MSCCLVGCVEGVPAGASELTGLHNGLGGSTSNFVTTTFIGGAGSGSALNLAQSPYYVAYQAGKLYLSDLTNNAIREVDMTTGEETTIAGTGFGGYSGDGAPANQAEVNQPAGIAVDALGDVIFADQSNYRIREIASHDSVNFGISMKAGYIYTIGGTGSAGFSGDSGPAIDAQIGVPQGLALDSNGDVLFADTSNNRVREISATPHSQFGVDMSTGYIYTIAGNGLGGSSGYSGDSQGALDAEVGSPQGIYVDSYGDVFITQDFGQNNGPVRVISASTKQYFGIQMAAGDIYTVAGGGTNCTGSQDALGNGCEGPSSTLRDPVGVTQLPSGTLLITDYYNELVRQVSDTTGIITNFAGTGQAGYSPNGTTLSSTKLAYPTGLATGPNGDVYISDSTTVVEYSGLSGLVSTVVGNGTFSYSVDGVTAQQSQIGLVANIAIDQSGDVFLSDETNNTIDEIPKVSGTYFGQFMVAGSIYTIAGNGFGVGGIYQAGGFRGDGGPAISSILNSPLGIATDSLGDVFFVDSGNSRVREISATTHAQFGIDMTAGDIYTVAGDGQDVASTNGALATQSGLLFPNGVTVDPQGNLYVSEDGTASVVEIAAQNATVYQSSNPMQEGHIYRAIGTGSAGYLPGPEPLSGAELNKPAGMCFDANSDLFIADSANNAVVEVSTISQTSYGTVMKPGFAYTIAGTGYRGDGVTGGPGVSTELNSPTSVVLDSSNNLWIADSGNNLVRSLQLDSGTLINVAGDGQVGFGTDGANSLKSSLASPSSIAFGKSGNLYIAQHYLSNAFGFDDAVGSLVKVTGIVSSQGPPSVPTGVTVEPGYRSLTVRWNVPVETGGSPIEFYTVSMSPGGATKTIPAGTQDVIFSALDPSNSYVFSVTASNTSGESQASIPSSPQSPLSPPNSLGYYLFSSSCSLTPFGEAPPILSGPPEPAPGMAYNSCVTGEIDPTQDGAWLVTASGSITTVGTAQNFGSLANVKLTAPIVGMATTQDGQGYWLVASDGGVFSFGDAGFYGSAGNLDLVAPIVGMATTQDGQGYWLVASDGGVFSFGDARFWGAGAPSSGQSSFVGIGNG